jgi:dCMP deaminase
MIYSKWDLRFLDLAELVSHWSKDPSTKCGAVLTAGKLVASLGYNGFPAALQDDPVALNDRVVKYPRIVHAEMNALLHGAGRTSDTLYTYPFLPCDRCFVHMLEAGVTRFVAPVPRVEHLSRWGEAFQRTREMAVEARVRLLEVPGYIWSPSFL